MGKQLDARTEWEVDAARRREVIEGDFAVRRVLRGDAGEEPVAVSDGFLSTLRGWLASSAEEVDEAPCAQPGAMKAAKPGM